MVAVDALHLDVAGKFKLAWEVRFGIENLQEDTELVFAVELELFVEDVFMQAQALEMLVSFQAPIQLGKPDESEISLYRVQYALPYFWKSCWHTSLTQVVATTVLDKLDTRATANSEERIAKANRIEAYGY